ncbi:MAG: RHS repeat protein, partial [Desulfobacterales bacterium]|nr:RHS repeat protein [Desulfobacterales bacterium]
LLSRSQPSVLGVGPALTIWDYDNDGNTVSNETPTRLVHRKIEQGFTRDSQGATVPHETVTTFTYNTKGQVLTIDGPLTGFQDRTEFQYDPVTGDLLSATHPLGGTTWFSNYDPAGRPKRVTDPNGAVTSLTHDPMGRPATVTRQSDGACRTYTYNPAGEMATVTLENGATYSFTYDNVYGRLIRTTDNQGNYQEYGYDAQGNRTSNTIHHADGTRVFQQQFDFQGPDHPGKLQKIINPDGSFTQFAYDIMGNLSSVTDPLGNTTAYIYN